MREGRERGTSRENVRRLSKRVGILTVGGEIGAGRGEAARTLRVVALAVAEAARALREPAGLTLGGGRRLVALYFLRATAEGVIVSG